MSSFFNTLKASGVLTPKAPWQAKAKSPQVIFIKAALANKLKLKVGAVKKTQWFEQKDDGSFVITPRIGTSIMQFEGSRVQIAAKNQEEALTVVQGIIDAAKAGEFDEQLNEVRSKRQANKSVN